MDKIYLVGAEGKLQRRGWAQGRALPRRETEKLTVTGARDRRSGSIGSHRRPCSKEPGDSNQAGLFSFGRLAVSYLSQIWSASSCIGSRYKQSTASFRVLLCYHYIRRTVQYLKMSLVALSTIRYMQLDKYTAFWYQSIWSILREIWYSYLGRYATTSISCEII